MVEYTQHPLSAAFPALSAEDFQALKDSIEDLGVQNPITVYEGQVLDGWNRYRAACELGVECPERGLDDWIDPLAFVKSQNKERRHLPIGAWALIEVRLREWNPVGTNQHGGHAPGAHPLKVGWAPGAHPPEPAGKPRAQSMRAASAASGHSERTLKRAKVVDARAVPEVQDAVMANKLSLKAAEQIARLPAEDQPKALEGELAGRNGVRHDTSAARENFPQVEGKTRDLAAKAAGFGNGKTYEQAKAVDATPEEAPPDYTELDAAHDQIAELQAALALAKMGGATETDRQQAHELIQSLQAGVKSLTAELRAVKVTRDALLREVAEMKKQLAGYRRLLDRQQKEAREVADV